MLTDRKVLIAVLGLWAAIIGVIRVVLEWLLRPRC
jgi:hypothetical protein